MQICGLARKREGAGEMWIFCLGCLYSEIREEDFDRGLVRYLPVCLFEDSIGKISKFILMCCFESWVGHLAGAEEQRLIVTVYSSVFDEFWNLFLVRRNVNVTRRYERDKHVLRIASTAAFRCRT